MVEPAREQCEKRDTPADAWAPDESGQRPRPAGGQAIARDTMDDTIEEIELELVTSRRRRPPPPPPPRRASRSLPAPTRERVDLDAIVQHVSQTSLPALGTAPRLEPPRSRPSWTVALLLMSGALAFGAASAVVLSWARGAFATPVASPAALAEAGAAMGAARVDIAEPGELTEPARIAEPVRMVEIVDTREQPIESPAPSVLEVPSPEPVLPNRGREARRARRHARAAEGARRSVASAPAQSARAGEARAARAAEGSLPEQPSREDVERAVESVLPDVRACAPGMGVAQLELHFAPSGRATTAQIRAARASPEQRSCIARAARAARVPAFSASHLSVSYPVQL